MTIYKFLFILLLFTLFLVVDLSAQPGDPGGGGNPGAVPISGLGLLLIAGGVLGVRSIIRSNRD